MDNPFLARKPQSDRRIAVRSLVSHVCCVALLTIFAVLSAGGQPRSNAAELVAEPASRVRSRVFMHQLPLRAAAAARSSSATRASTSSISIALAEWSNTLSAARTRVECGAVGSTMIFSRVVTAALEACCKRDTDCRKARRRASR
jgi:hypothetical protein